MGVSGEKNRIHPSWNEIKNFHDPLTDGEVTLARFLDDYLPESWEIFVTPHLNGSRPDVVIFNRNVGGVVYEVKDWDLASNQFRKKRFNELGNAPFWNPVKQVNHYKNKIIELVPLMGEQIDSDRKAYSLIKERIYFHKAFGEVAREFLDHPKFCYVFGNDELDENNLDRIAPGWDIQKSKFFNEKWAEEILFWLRPPFHSKEQTQPLALYNCQKVHAEPRPGHFRLRGVVGSGKTLIIAYRAAKLASEGFKVLVVTYNITLRNYVREMIARAPFNFEWGDITIIHFHGFCKDVLNELGVAPKSISGYVNTVASAIEMAESSGKDTNRLKYDAILIDEGQDYEWDWYALLCRFLKDRDELLLVCDKKQNIYERDLTWIDKGMRNVKFRGAWRELKEICRIPKKIGDAANRFSHTFDFDEELKVERYIQLKIFERPPNPHIVWKNIKSENWLSEVEKAYQTVKNAQSKSEEGHPSDVVILFAKRGVGLEAVDYFENEGIRVNHVFEGDHESKYHRNKKSFWTGDGRLKMSTIHSFKGWEAIHVILLIPERWHSVTKLDSLVYTAMTRSRENLIVLNCNFRYYEFGSTLPDSWEEQ